MAGSSNKPWQRMIAARGAALAGGSSVLRLAAHARQGQGQNQATPPWLAGLTRALRAAGPGQGARPLHAVLAGGDFAPSAWLGAR